MSKQNIDQKVVKSRLHVLGVDAEVDPVIGKKLRRGIYAPDRIHSLVMGFPGSGKTRFLLSMIKQHIDHGEGFMVIDSHSDLTQLVLSHIPPEQWVGLSTLILGQHLKINMIIVFCKLIS